MGSNCIEHFEEILRLERARATVARIPLSLCFLDVDALADLGTAHGPDAIDAIVSAVGVLADNSIRRRDRLLRCGEQRFVVLLPGTDMSGAMRLAGRLVAEVAEAFIRFRGATIHVTCSAGVAAVGADDSSGATAASLADIAVRAAQKLGGNAACPGIAVAIDGDDDYVVVLE